MKRPAVKRSVQCLTAGRLIADRTRADRFSTDRLLADRTFAGALRAPCAPCHIARSPAVPYNDGMEFPVTRLRRLRRSEPMRALVRETHLEPGALIQPIFLCPGQGVRRAIGSMPGVFNLSTDEAVKEAEAAAALGIGGLLLFGLPENKDEEATGAWDDEGIVQSGLRALKQSSAAENMLLIADVCLCEYTSH